MRNLRGTYVHRGDAARRRKRTQRTLFVLSSATFIAIVMASRKPGTANAEVTASEPSSFSFSLGGGRRELRDELATARGELDLLRAQYERADKIIKYSTRFGIPANLAGNILEAAVAEGIDPELGFRLVALESEFNPRATSHVGAIGLTQVMLGTAKYFDRGITKERLYEPKTNLRVGFRYLRALISEQKGDAKLALLVYNRGPVAVESDQRHGVDPSNGYDRILTKGYKGKGVVD